jgi:hypothetical protein
MSKIYAVLDEDHRIVSLFDDKEKLDWFLNGYEKDWVIETYEANDTGGLRVLNVYHLTLSLDSLDPIEYETYAIPVHPGYCRYKGKMKTTIFVEVRADSLDEAVDRAKCLVPYYM